MQYPIFPAAVLIKRCHDARCDDGGASWGQKVRPGRRTQEAPTNLETPSAVILFNIFFALTMVNFKKLRKLIGEQHFIYFNMFLTKVFIHYPPRNCAGGNCPADKPHKELHAERGSLKVIKMEFYKSSYLRFEIL